MEGANFGAPSGNALDFGDHPPAHVPLKGIGGDVPERGQKGEDADPADDQQIFPPASRSGGELGHRVCTPSPVDPAGPGTLTLLSERKDWSQEIISSLTFSWVSSSRILAATSADGVSPATGCFN